MKVIVVSYDFYSEYSANKLFLKSELEKNGYIFEFWSAAGISIMKKSLISTQKQSGRHEALVFDDLEKLCISIKAEAIKNPTIFILNLLTQNKKTLKIFKYAVKYGVWCFKFDLQVGFYRAILDHSQESQKKILPYLKKPLLLVKKAQNRINSYYWNKQFYAQNYTVFGTGKFYGNHQTSLNYGDLYDTKKEANVPALVDKPYIVFCDIFLPFHPDFAMAGIPQVDAKKYFSNLNSFFLQLENRFKMPVVIAGHPRSAYSDEFQGRMVFTGKTHLLVRDATLALIHFSSSIFYACMYNIPAIHIFDSNFEITNTSANKVMKDIKAIQKLLQLRLLNIENEELLELPLVDKERYTNFLQKYLLAADYPLTNFEIFERFLKSKNLV